MSAGIVLQQMIIIFLLIITGYLVYKKGIIQGEVSRGISALVVNVCNPALLIRSAFSGNSSITPEKLLLSIAGAAVVYAILLAAAFLLPRCIRAEEKWKNHYALMSIFGNMGFIGIPLAAAVLGEESIIYVAIMNAFYNLLFYTIGVRLADGKKGRVKFRDFLNVGNISIIIMIFIYVVQPKLPEVVVSSVNYIADTTTFLAMLVIGVSLARTKLLDVFTYWKMYLFIALRFLAVPIFIGLLLRLFIKDSVMYGALVLMAAVPVGNLPLMRVEEKGGDGSVLSCGIILSTILSLVTIPLVVAFV